MTCKRTNRGLINLRRSQTGHCGRTLCRGKVEVLTGCETGWLWTKQHRFPSMQAFRMMKKPNHAGPDRACADGDADPRTLALSLDGELVLDASSRRTGPPGTDADC